MTGNNNSLQLGEATARSTPITPGCWRSCGGYRINGSAAEKRPTNARLCYNKFRDHVFFMIEGAKMRKVLLDGENFYTISQMVRPTITWHCPRANESLFNFILALLQWDDIYVFDPCHNSYPTKYSEFFSKYKSLFTELTLSPGRIEFYRKQILNFEMLTRY